MSFFDITVTTEGATNNKLNLNALLSQQYTKHHLDKIITSLLSLRDGETTNMTEGEIGDLLAWSTPVLLQDSSLLRLCGTFNIIGDIKGNFKDLKKYFEHGGKPPYSKYLFLGNYVNIGKYGIEVVCLLLALKIRYPHHVYLLRGNHDSLSLTRIYGFYDQVKSRYAIMLWKKFTNVINCLPIAAILNRIIFCVHSGLSDELKTLDQIQDITRPTDVPDSGLLTDLLWSSPDNSITGFKEVDKGGSSAFGEDVIRNFLNQHGFELIVRGEQVVEHGYEFFNRHRDLVTIFSSSNYHGEFDNDGAMMLVDENSLCTFKVIKYNPSKKQ
jgi:serine/threonine-protein phosphatase PP1 catalytic subunit